MIYIVDIQNTHATLKMALTDLNKRMFPDEDYFTYLDLLLKDILVSTAFNSDTTYSDSVKFLIDRGLTGSEALQLDRIVLAQLVEDITKELNSFTFAPENVKLHQIQYVDRLVLNIELD